MRKNTDQNNLKYGHFLHSVIGKKGHIDSWFWIESLQPIYGLVFAWFCKDHQPILCTFVAHISQ